MSSTRAYIRRSGCVSIPVEIVPQTNPSYRTYHSTSSSSSSWKKPTNRFQPRQSPITAYDRVINNSPSYQPYYPHRIYETNLSHSNEDLLSSSRDTKSSKYNNSDFIQTSKNSFRRSYDALNDYPEESYKNSHDRSHSPASQCDDSPTRPPPPASSSQQQYSDFKINNPTQSNDQQVPTTIEQRDPNLVALEKLEQIQKNLLDLDEQVNAFTGSTRDDRIYKVLDEQALKMMMRCDELIDVSSDIKEKRKEMIQNVQTVLAKLESKVPIVISYQMETTLIVHDPLEEDKSSKSPKDIEEKLSTEQST